MRRAKLLLAAAAAAGLGGQLASGANYTWLSFAGGTYQWNGAGVWSPAGFPNADNDSALLSGAITGGPLNVGLPANFTVATLSVGDTNAVFPIDIGAGNSGGGVLTFDNSAGAGTATIVQAGGSGAVTTFSAPVQLGRVVGAGTTAVNSNIWFEGNAGTFNFNDVTLFSDPDASDGTALVSRTLRLNSGSQTTGATWVFNNIQLSQPGAVTRGQLVIASAQRNSPTVSFAHGGTVIFNGVISNGGITGGQVLLGQAGGNGNTVATVPTTFVFNTNNTYNGTTQLNRGIFLIKADQPFGTGLVNQNAIANAFGTEIRTDNDSRAIPNNIQIAHTLLMGGEHSITWNGHSFQSNNRELLNLLPEGKTWTINGFVAAATAADGATETARALTFDGAGNTVVNGPIYNHRRPWFPGSSGDAAMDRAVDPDFGAFGGLAKRGTGILTINSTVLPTISDGTTSFTGPPSTLLGPTSVAGGLLQFASPEAYGRITSWSGGSLSINNSPGTSRINVIAGGAIGVLTGTLTPEFLAKFNNSTMAIGNSGAVALAPADAAVNIDYTTAPFNGAGLVGTSIGAVASGVTYTGTITPDATRGYRLGGGGTLTL
ncbi:MAG: hypothetical protein RMJ35_07990, partial [Phycisphaerales bacterium]|nr:hypothetical protein [Phycisphaerales bacterium]